ncbi:sodium channel protein type 4 subunit alpha-like [Clavelina lepadiformis]|uniref:sodium channel protein type 4 subunit alpha-like n=1 Tax=Clavelina lepadiformis TaxID=159417 RepID=UPI004041C090
MAMIRGRALGRLNEGENNKKDEYSVPTIADTSSKTRPLARLKQQRRLTISYSKTPEKVLVPIDDPDPYYKDKKTFLVLNRDRVIYRFSEEKSLFLFGRSSKVRKTFVNILINKYPLFEEFIYLKLTIVTNDIRLSIIPSQYALLCKIKIFQRYFA